MFDKCPGADSIRTPKLKVKKCPECGGDVEIFSTDLQVKCPTCGIRCLTTSNRASRGASTPGSASEMNSTNA